MEDIPAEYRPYVQALTQQMGLYRPLAFIDLETTGTNALSARIVEIAVVKVFPNGEVDLRVRRVNPGIPIPPEATAIHGITDDDVRDEPEFRRFAASLEAYLADCDIAGFGIVNFDVRVLQAEFGRAGQSFSIEGRSIVDGLAVFFDREPRNLAAAMRFYRNKTLDNAHSAKADALASIEVLLGQFQRYPDLPTDLPSLDKIAAPRRPEPDWLDETGLLVWIDGEVCLNFGKHKGSRIRDVMEVSPEYFDWMLAGDFPDTVKAVLTDARKRSFPSKH